MVLGRKIIFMAQSIKQHVDFAVGFKRQDITLYMYRTWYRLYSWLWIME